MVIISDNCIDDNLINNDNNHKSITDCFYNVICMNVEF